MMKHYKFCLHKRYFDQGYGMMSYLKVLLALTGVGGLFAGIHVGIVIAGGVLFGIACYVVGRAWFHFNFVDAEVEVTNRINPFVREMRNSKIFKPEVPMKNKVET